MALGTAGRFFSHMEGHQPWHQMNPRIGEHHEEYMHRVAPQKKKHRTELRYDPTNTSYTHTGPKGERGAITDVVNILTFSLSAKPGSGTGICSRYLVTDLNMNPTSAVNGLLWPTSPSDVQIAQGQYWTVTDSWLATAPQFCEYRLQHIKLSFVPLQSLQTGPQVSETGTTINNWLEGLYDNAEIRIGLMRPDSQLNPPMYPVAGGSVPAPALNETYYPLTCDPEQYMSMPFSKYYRWSDLTTHGRQERSIVMHQDSLTFDQWWPTGTYITSPTPSPDYWGPAHVFEPLTDWQPGAPRDASQAAFRPRYAWIPYVYVDLHLESTLAAHETALPVTPINMFQVRLEYRIEYRRPVWLFGQTIPDEVTTAKLEQYRQQRLKAMSLPKCCTVERGITLGRDPLTILAAAAEAVSRAEDELLGVDGMAACDMRSIGSGSLPAPAPPPWHSVIPAVTLGRLRRT